MNIHFNIRREQRSQREDGNTLRTSIDELYNYTVDNYTYEDVGPKNVKEIQDINRVGKRIVRPYGENYRGRYVRDKSIVRGNSF